jgi:hypothetical protein
MPFSVAARAGDGVAGPGTAGITPALSSAGAPPWLGEVKSWLGEVQPWLGEVQPKASRADQWSSRADR